MLPLQAFTAAFCCFFRPVAGTPALHEFRLQPPGRSRRQFHSFFKRGNDFAYFSSRYVLDTLRQADYTVSLLQRWYYEIRRHQISAGQ